MRDVDHLSRGSVLFIFWPHSPSQPIVSSNKTGTIRMRVRVFALVAAGALSAGMTTAEARPFDPSGNLIEWSEFDTERSEGRRNARSERARGRRPGAHRAEHRTAQRAQLRRLRRSHGPGRRQHAIQRRRARPRRWCGWWMRTQRGGGPAFNVAWNWRNYGRATSPQVGAVVVWRHHVGEIVGQASNGQWIVRSGNDGGAVRTRARSVAGAIFRI